MREGTRQILERHPDIEVVGEAATGRQAVSKAERLQPDVLLLDISMPDLNGIEAARPIREISPETKILVLAAYDDEYGMALMKEAPPATS